MLPGFAYVRATTVADAVRQLTAPGARLHAGGTDLLGCLRDGVFTAQSLVSIGRLKELSGITAVPAPTGGLRIGAMTTHSHIAADRTINQSYRALAQAAAAVASPQLRNQGTIGGNLCQRPRCWYFRGEFHCARKGGDHCFAVGGENQNHAIFGGGACVIVHPSDTAPALIALGAKARVAGPGQSRTVPLSSFFVGPATSVTRETILEKNEIVTEILLPAVEPGLRSSYRKVRGRGAWDFALAGIAVALLMKGSTVARARVVFSGVAPVPWRSEAVEQTVTGKTLTADVVAAAAEAGAKGATPLEKNGYKVPMLKGIITEALLRARVEAKPGSGDQGDGEPKENGCMFAISAALLSASTIAVRDCMGAKPGERVLVVTDEPMRLIGFALHRAARELGLDVLLADMVPRKSNGEEPPPEVAELMTRFDVVLCPTSKSLTHTDSRRAASLAGARVATLPGVTEAIMVRCMNADYTEIAARTFRLCALLEKTKAVRVTAPAGTDITMPIAGRQAHASSGLFREKGQWGNLPTGEAYLAPLEGRSNGVVVVDGSMAGVGMMSEPLRIVVENGYATEINGGPEATKLIALLEPHGKDARTVAEFGIGTNDKAILTGIILEDEKVMGTIHIAFGDNKSMGGSVRVASHLDGLVKSPTVWFDDVRVMEEGRLLVG